MRQRVVVVAGCAIAAAGALVAARVLSASRAAWEAGEDRIAEYNRLAGSGADDAERRLALLREAIVLHREAASWDLPLNPWARRAAARLVTIGQKAELADDEDLAFSAYRAARASAMETRTFAAPATEALDRASRGIARLSARALPPVRGQGSGVRGQGTLPAPAPDPDPWLSLLGAAGLVAWIAAAAAFALRGMDERGRIRPRAAIGSAAVAAAGLASWLAGLSLA